MAELSPVAGAHDPRGVRSAVTVFTTARLRRGVTIEQAQSELDVIAANLAERYPATNKDYRILAMARFSFGHYDHLPEIIQVLVGAVGCLMLIACANVASLLLVRANARQREISVRAALGASRGRLIRQLLTENILVALIGGAGGVLLAQWALDFIRSCIPSGVTNLIAAGEGLARLAYLEIDGGVLTFALGLSMVTALVFGLAPAWLSSSADLNEALKQGTRGSTEGRSRSRFRATLVAVEIAIAVTLLACSGLFIRSFLKLAAYDPGFDPKHTAFVRLALPGTNYAEPEQKIAFANALISRIQGAPGVEAVGLTSFFPLSQISGSVAGFEIEGGPAIAVAELPLSYFHRVSPDYFRAMGIPLKQGRFFSDHDDAKAPRVAIINQTLARQHFPNQNPVGQRIKLMNQSDAWRVIVGIVGDVGQSTIGEVQPAQFYEPVAQNWGFGVVVVRDHGNPALLPAIVKQEVHALDSNLPVGETNTVEDFLRIKLTVPRLTLHLLLALALIGLLIAAIGIYGVIAFSVSQRTVEIGIRMALGAQMQDVLRLVLRQGAAVVGIGFALGTVATFIAGRAIESQLYNTSGRDPASLVGVMVFFAAVAALACWLPARRATKINPVDALRAE